MTNLTLTIDDEVLRRARIRALEAGTSVNALVRDHLAAYASDDRQTRARARLVELAKEHSGSSGPEGRTWTRESIQRYPS